MSTFANLLSLINLRTFLIQQLITLLAQTQNCFPISLNREFADLRKDSVSNRRSIIILGKTKGKLCDPANQRSNFSTQSKNK